MQHRLESIFIHFSAISIFSLLFVFVIIVFTIYADLWNSIHSLIIVLPIIASPILYFFRLYKKESDNKYEVCKERKRVSRILYDEMSGILDSINIIENSSNIISIPLKNGKITYTNKFFKSDIYDRFKFSDKLNFLDYKLHQEIQNIFQIIKDHDTYLSKLTDIEDAMLSSNSKIDDAKDNLTSADFRMAHRYYKKLHESEKFLLMQIPIILKNLKKELHTKC